MDITSQDIALKLYKRWRYWFKGPPKVILLPPVGDSFFGTLRFLFPDKTVDYKVLYRDCESLKEKAQYAVDNFPEIINFEFELGY